MDTMKASFLVAPETIELREIPVPVAGPGQVLLRVTSVGVCGSDVHYFRHGGIGSHIVREPLILGHEPAGMVEDVGEGVSPSLIGKRVSIEPGIPDGVCSQCRAGRYNLCPNMVFFATPPVHGVFSEYVTHPASFVYELPDHVGDDEGALIEPLSVGLWANRLAGTAIGHRVLIAGAGPVGLLAAQVARVAGATEIVVSDLAPGRRETALALGATVGVDPSETDLSDLGADVFIDCSGAPPAITGGLKALRPGGTAVLVGLGANEIQMPMPLIQDRELTIKGNFRYANTWPIGIDLVSRGLVKLKELVTGHYDLEHVADALSVLPDSGAIKTIVTP